MSLPEAAEEEAEELCIPAIGVDPGSVNMGIGGIKLYGVTRLLDVAGNTVKTIPRFDITGGERWDITRGIVYRPAKNMFDLERWMVSPAPHTQSKKLQDWTANIGLIVPKTGWLFESSRSLLVEAGAAALPDLVIENQSDFIDRTAPKLPNGKPQFDYQKAVMVPIANAVATAILTSDAVKFEDDRRRERCGAMSKYGQRCDGSRDRPERKEQVVVDMKELLAELATPNALSWLAWFENMEAIGEQIHDICDALSLALEASLKKYEKHGRIETRLFEQRMRAELKERRELIRSIPKATMRAKKPKKASATTAMPDFTDEHLPQEDDCASLVPLPARKPRKKAAPKRSDDTAPKKARKPRQNEGPSKKRAREESDTDVDVTKKKRKQTKKRKSDDDDDDEIIILVEAQPKRKKTKTTDAESKYPVLLFDRIVPQ